MSLITRLAALERSRRADAERVAGAIEDRMIAACGGDEAAMLIWIDQLYERDPETAERWAIAYGALGLMARAGDHGEDDRA